jgi:hypothetical protein
MAGMASRFDRVNGRVDPGALADEVADFLVRGLIRSGH